VALPFGLIVTVQVGLMVHLVSLLLPPLGAAGAGLALAVVAGCAVVGRVALGMVVDRVDQRRAGAAGAAVQMAGMALLFAVPAEAWALYLGCVLFGLWVGNNITLPPLLLQRAFGRDSFGGVVGLYSALVQLGYTVTPGVFGVVHDLAGGYGPVLLIVLAAQGIGAALLLRRGAVA
jgi:predicted MFS family arabinose efflux permease